MRAAARRPCSAPRWAGVPRNSMTGIGAAAESRCIPKYTLERPCTSAVGSCEDARMSESTRPSADGVMRDFVGYAGRPPDFAWPNDARIAVNVVLNYEEGSERTPLEGDT